MNLQDDLVKYKNLPSTSLQQKETAERMVQFFQKTPNCFSRESLTGHFTGSAWILNQSLNSTCLIFHRKLQKWMQPGGHADGNPHLLEVARREAIEETGVKILACPMMEFYDLDIHSIPSRGHEPAHDHHDVRFLFVADESAPLQGQEDEVNQVKWIPLKELRYYTQEMSVLRLAEKTLERSARLNQLLCH